MLGSWVRAPDGSQKRLLETEAFFVCVSCGEGVSGVAFVTECGDSVTIWVPVVVFVTECGDFVTTEVPGMVFVTGCGDFVTTAVPGAAAYPRRGCLAWTPGASR